jgi:hypothetical protein
MWKKNMTGQEVVQLIERFLDNQSLYPQEWNDFVDTPQSNPAIEVYRRQCEDLEHRFNHQGEPDEIALAQLREMIVRLRSGNP